MHRFSFISGKENEESLGVKYQVRGDKIKGDFIPKSTHTSYENIVHGGLLAALIDDAMASLLLAKTVKAYTGRLSIRFREKVYVNDTVSVEAWIEKERSPLFILKGLIKKGNKVCLEAEALFMKEKSSY